MTQDRYIINLVGTDINGAPMMRPSPIDVREDRGVTLEAAGVKVWGPEGFVFYPWHRIASVQYFGKTGVLNIVDPQLCAWCDATFDSIDSVSKHVAVCPQRVGPRDARTTDNGLRIVERA